LVRDFAALHMTWGAANELTTLTAYRRLIDRTEHPILRDLLNCIIKDERRHFAFYRSQARLRLGRSPRARAITRWALEHLWAPVGTGVRPQQETDHVIVLLFGDDDCGLKAALEIQDTMRELPGLEGTRAFEVARAEAMARVRSRLRSAAVSPPMAALPS
jgi:hypothetical protein